MEKYNILIAGVGGQGTLFASRVLGQYAVLKGYDCKLSEVHGMAQRGGSVVTYVKIGEKIYSPVINEGEADVVLAFELLEAARWRHYLKEVGIMISNRQKIMPLPVITGDAVYPENLDEKLKNCNINYIDAADIADKLGNIKTVNTVMLGVLARQIQLSPEIMKKAIRLCVNEKVYVINEKAFDAGYYL